MLLTPVALERAGDGFLRLFAATVAKRGEGPGIALAVEDRSDDRHASQARDVAHDLGQFHVHQLESSLDVLNVVRGVTHQHRALPKVAAQDADLIGGPERSSEQSEGVELLDPLAVEDITL